MNKCDDCGLIDPPDTHTCQQYEDRIKAEHDSKSLEQLVNELEQRIEELERRVAALSIKSMEYSPWKR